MEKFTPLDNRVLVQVEDREQKINGIFVPNNSQEQLQRGTVISIGNGHLSQQGVRVPLTVNVGDIVLFTKYGVMEIKINGEDYKILNESDIVGIIGEE